MGKKVVFVGHYNGGKKDFDSRHYFFAKELVKIGCKVTIINAAYSHRIQNAKLIKEPYIKSYDDEVCFLSIKTPFYKGNGIKRIINMLCFTINLIKSTKSIIKEIGAIDNIVMATPHPFQFFAAKFISMKSKSKLIIDVKDIWPLSVTELMRVSALHPFVLFLKMTEILMYRYSDLIVSPLCNINEYFKENKFKNTAEYIPTGIDISYYESIGNENLPIKIPNDKFIVGYVGGITTSNAVDFLLEVASNFEQENDIVFLIVGDGANKENLIKKYNKHNIVFCNAVTKSQAFCVMKKCDVLYRASPNLNLYKYGISPLKINEYMYSCTPIIHVFDFEKHDVVMKAKCGISVKYGDVKGLVDSIYRFYNMSSKERLEIGNNGKKFVEENLPYSIIAKKFIKLID